jgi:GT2 family glycosyltransferase
MYVVPNDPARLGNWEPHEPTFAQPGGDFTFIRETCEKMGGPVWREEITSVIRPHDRGPSITIVTPWLGHHELAADYVAAVEPELRVGDEVVIVDNGDAPDLPFTAVARGLHGQHLNLGFAAGCNFGLLHVQTDAVLFLNNDVAPMRPGWLEQIRSALEPGFLCGPIRTGQHTAIDGILYPYIDGWCLAGMTADLYSLGGFDEDLAEPAYYSDNLLCLQARMAGMTLRDVQVSLHHKTSVTSEPGRNPQVEAASTSNRAAYLELARSAI